MKTHIILTFLILLSNSLFAQPDSLWKKANEKYIQQNYQEAAEAYEKILENGYESADLYYNIGNAYFKLGNVPFAILNYERARLLNPRDEDIQFNLELARTQTVDKIEVLPSVVFKNWYHRFLNITNTFGWAILSVVTFISFLILILIYLFSKQLAIKKSSFIAGIVCLVLSINSFIFASNSKSILRNNNDAVITDPSVVMRGEPNEGGTELFVLHEGTKVTITDRVGEWVEVSLTDGNNGWMKEEDLIKLRQD